MKLPQYPIELCAASNDPRNYLNGVYFDAIEKTWITTNGHMMCIVKAEVSPEDTESGVVTLIAWAEARRAYSALQKLSRVKIIDFNIQIKNKNFLIPNGRSWPCIDGQYPDYRKSLPRQADRPIKINVSAKYLNIAGKIVTAANKNFNGIIVHAAPLDDYMNAGSNSHSFIVNASAADAEFDLSKPLVVVLPTRI